MTQGPGTPYITILLYESHSPDSADYRPLYQEDIVLLYADSQDAAKERAAQRGRERETSYRNAEGETITWRLKHVIDVNPALDADLSRDADLYSRHFRNYDAYQRFEPLLSGEQL
ncbi:MAG TPA: DUF4288 domain-containing protein [Pseudonocardiaceae bacterium]